MNSKKIVSLLTIGLIISIILISPVYAIQWETGEPLSFEIYEETAGQGSAVYGKLTSVEKLSDLGVLTSVIPYYSVDGETYQPHTYFDQMDWVVQGGERTSRLCFASNDQPYKDYLEGSISSFYVKLCIKGTSDTGQAFEIFSAPAKLEEMTGTAEEEVLPDTFTVYPLRYFKGMTGGSFKDPIYSYNITVKQNASLSDILALLPDSMEMESQIQPEDDVPVSVEPVNCTVSWGDNLEKIQTSQVGQITQIIPAINLTVPKVASATINGKLYSYNPKPTEKAFNLVVNVVGNDPPAIQLANESDGLRFSMVKPSGAKSYQPEYSLDGGTTWVAGENIPLDSNIINNIPKAETISLRALASDETPMKEYLADNSRGFLVRVRIIGGTLDGYTNTAAWPGDYVYVPGGSSESDGSGGHRGDSGNDNSGTGGIRDDRPTMPTIPDDLQQTIPQEQPSKDLNPSDSTEGIANSTVEKPDFLEAYTKPEASQNTLNLKSTIKEKGPYQELESPTLKASHAQLISNDVDGIPVPILISVPGLLLVAAILVHTKTGITRRIILDIRDIFKR